MFSKNLGSISEDEADLLSKKKVFIAGCGGLGCYSVEMLTRVGIGSLTVADGDCFEISNLNRQLYSSSDTIGKLKVDCAKEKALSINANINFTAIPEYVGAGNAEKLISGCDIVIDALDSVSDRNALASACDGLGIPFVFGAIDGWSAQAGISLPGDGMIDRLYSNISDGRAPSSLSFTPALCASVQCSLAVSCLCGRKFESGKIYMFNLQDFDWMSMVL